MEFKYSQLASSIGKAINHQETPVKEKHVRSAIIGTYHEKGGTTFWAVVGTLPIQENPIVCWKFCHTLHKLLREGHPNVLPESQAYRQRLRELGKYWGHLRHNFGKLIACYCRLLSNKLEFHAKNPKFPGHLQLTNEQLDTIGEMDINNYFQITVEMFDFMDEILTLQAAVFGSLETGRANSMTSSGQCRLAPLIPCIQDSSHLYDYLVKLLFKLHSSLPPDVLLGHRDRFYKQFKVLRDFYKNTSILQYFKHLIQIPLLPEEPPNFLIKSEIHSHVSPVVVLPPQDDTADTDSIDMSLVDTSGLPLLELEPTNGAIHDNNSEKDRLIERLQQEIEHLKREIHRIRMEDQQLIDELRHQMAAVQGKLSALQQQLLAKNGEIEILRAKAVSAEKNVQAAEKLVEAEKKSKSNEDKFQKMKDVYYKLREEHINLLRAKADVEKQLMGAKQLSQSTDKDKSATNKELEDLKQKLQEEKQLRIAAEMMNKDLIDNGSKRKALENVEFQRHTEESEKGTVISDKDDTKRQKLNLKEGLKAIVNDKSQLEDMLKESMSTNVALNEVLHKEYELEKTMMGIDQKIENNSLRKSEIETDLEKQLEICTDVIGKFSEQKEALSKERMDLDSKLAILAEEQMEIESNFINNPQQSSQKLEILTQTRDQLERKESNITAQLQKVNNSKESAEAELNKTMEKANEKLNILNQEITSLQNEKLKVQDELEKSNLSKKELMTKLTAIEKQLARQTADAHANSQDMDELLMMAVDEMYLAQNQERDETTEDCSKIEEEKKKLEKRVKELENDLKLRAAFKSSENADMSCTDETHQSDSVSSIQEDKKRLKSEKLNLESKLAQVLNEEESLEAALRKNDLKQQLNAIANVNDDERRELEEMLLTALDEKYIAEQLMNEDLENADERFKKLYKERKSLLGKVMLLEGKLDNALSAKSQVEESFKDNSNLNAQEIAKLVEIKNELDNTVRVMTEKIQKLEEKSMLKPNKKNLESKLEFVSDKEENLEAALRKSDLKQQLNAIADVNNDERRELEEMLLTALDEKYIAEQLMNEDLADADQRFIKLDKERKLLHGQVMLLEGKLENALSAKSQIEDSFKDNSKLNAQEIAKLFEIKNELDNTVRVMTEEIKKMEEKNNLKSNEDLLEKSDLEELLLTAVDEAHIAEQLLLEESQDMENRYSLLYQERTSLAKKVLELEGRLANALNAKSSVEQAYLNSASLSATEMANIAAAKQNLEGKKRDITEQLQQMILEQEKTSQQNVAKRLHLETTNTELSKEKTELERKLHTVSEEKIKLEAALQSNHELAKKQLEVMAVKHHDLDLEKQELEELLLEALDEKYMTEQTASEDAQQKKIEYLQLIEQHKALKVKSLELEGKLTNALNAKLRIEKAFQESSSNSGQEMAQALYNQQENEYQIRDTVTKLEKALAEKEIAEKRVQEKTEEASKQVSELLREKQELELKNLALEENLTLLSSEKAIYEKNLQNTSDRLAKELENMEQKHIDLDMEKQELEEMLLAAVDETYMTEQMMKETSSDIEQEKIQLLQERNILRRKVMEFEGKLENAQAAKDTIQQAFQDNSSKLGQQIAHLTNEKYILEDEILNLRMQLSSESDTRMHAQQNQIDNFEKLSQDLKGKVSGLENQLVEVTEQKISLEQQVADLTGHVARLESEVESIKKDSEENKLKDSESKKLRQFQIFVSCIEEAEEIVQNAIRNFDDDATSPLTCSPEYLLKCGSGVLDSIDRLKREHYLFGLDQHTDVDALLRSLTAFSHLLSQFLLEGKATFNATADIEQGNQLLSACKIAGNDTLITLANMKTRGNVEEVESNLKKVGEDIKSACSAVELLISLAASKVEDRIEDLVERELADMDRAIEEAASRIAEILSKSRQAETGVKLEVSEKILDTCTALMTAIRELVKKSKLLQLEIVAQGKGHNSAKEFYKKNHQWTEGLLSAAKAVGMGAKFLVDAADKVVTGQAKFELLVAASQEIAASTAQLVVASKVKADPGSQNLSELSKASGSVRGCTGTVVATVKDCAQMIEDLDVMDFSNLSLHQAKRLEMESQVKVLELETNLEKERVKLSALRKRHYNLAGTGAGWGDEGN